MSAEQKDIFDALCAVGCMKRPETVLMDNWNRLFTITNDNFKVVVVVKDSSAGKTPKLEGVFTFTIADRWTDAQQWQRDEIQQILEIKPFPVEGAVAVRA